MDSKSPKTSSVSTVNQCYTVLLYTKKINPILWLGPLPFALKALGRHDLVNPDVELLLGHLVHRLLLILLHLILVQAVH